MRLFKKVIILVLLSCLNISLAWAKTNVKEAVVKIYTTYNEYDYYEPWQMLGQKERTGSGCIINGNRILTNAHVVGDQTFIQVRKAGDAKKYMAEVEIVAHECDLALLRVKDESFFSGVTPLNIGKLSEVKDRVAVYGFPEGGDELSITEGIVSRIEHRSYTHSGASLLTCQIDAAINNGSSGGPVIKDGKIVGVAFQSFNGENIGYMVPPPIIEHFMVDIQDGTYNGIPDIGVRTQLMENSDLRRKYQMSDNQTGNLVNEIYPDSPAKGILQVDDILLEIEGHSIANDGTVEFRKGERTSCAYFIQSKQINDKLKLKILRDGNINNVEITLSQPTNYYLLSPLEQYDVPPTYYILGGLVFEPLTLNFLKGFGEEWFYDAPSNLMYNGFYRKPNEDRREIILLTRILADEINVGYYWHFSIISRVNGNKISTMKDLVRALEENQEDYHIIEDEDGSKLILDKQKVDEYSKRIMDRYQISSDRSEDLRD